MNLPRLSPQLRTQAARFARLFVLAFATQAAALDLSHLGRSAIIAVVVGAAETAWRQLHPTVSAAITAPPAKAPPMPAPPIIPAPPPPPVRP